VATYQEGGRGAGACTARWECLLSEEDAEKQLRANLKIQHIPSGERAKIYDGTFRTARCLTCVRNALQSRHRREQHSGLFKEVKLNRGRRMASASQDF
jgi:hypothetical protein